MRHRRSNHRSGKPRPAHLQTRVSEPAHRAADHERTPRAATGDRAHRAATTDSAPLRSGLTAVGAVAGMVTVVLIVAGSMFSPSGASQAKVRPWWRTIVTRTVTATATVTVTVRPHTPTVTATATATVPGPTRTVTVTASPTPPTTSSTATASPTGLPGGGPLAGTPGLGIYMPGNNSGLDAYTAGWPAQPSVASFYLLWNSNVPPLMKTYASQGREIQAGFSTRSSDGSFVTWSDIAKGTYDARIVSMVKSLDALGVPVMLSLDVEPDGQFDKTGHVAPGQTPAQYVAAANHFADLIHANSTHVQSLLWLAGGRDAATEASFLPAHSKIDNIGWDPYKNLSHAVDETPTQLFSRYINTVLIPNGYGDIARHITETGIETDTSGGTSFSTQTQIDFYNGIPAAMAANDIDSVVWFRSNSGAHPYIPTDPKVDNAFASVTHNLMN